MRNEKVCEKMKFAFITVKYNTKRDVEKSRFQIWGPKRKHAKTLQFLNEMVVSLFDSTNFRRENYQISWGIHAKLKFSKAQSCETLTPVHQIYRCQLRRVNEAQPFLDDFGLTNERRGNFSLLATSCGTARWAPTTKDEEPKPRRLGIILAKLPNQIFFVREHCFCVCVFVHAR